MPRNAASDSPCIGVCQMDRRTGWCAGCLRNIDEIVAWGRADAATRQGVLAQLPERAARWDALAANGQVPPRPRG